MRDMGDTYRGILKKGYAAVDAYISVGTSIDATSVDDVTGITGGLLGLSSTAQASDAVYTLTPGMATYEGDGIPTSVSAGMVAPPLSAMSYPPETGLWSDVISDADGSISWTLTVALSAEHTSALTLYTDGPSITAGTVVFTASDGTTASEALICSSDYAQVATAHAYTSIAITVTAISEAYHHVRIAEIEYGASRALATTTLTGEVTLLEELDPTEKSLPMTELDFDIINVDGSFDPDNPASRLSEFVLGYPVRLSFTVRSGSSRWTVPMGRYWIGERSSADTSIGIHSFDARWFLSQSSASWSLSTGTSIGASLEAMLSDMGIPHAVDDALYEVYPDADHTFDQETTRLEDALAVEQAYGIYLVPQRSGVIQVTQTWPGGTADTLPLARMTSWPRPKQSDRYNYIIVQYAPGDTSTAQTVEKDLRTDTGETKSVLQVLGNPLVTTEARATATAERIAARLTNEEVEVECLGDPALDAGDTVPVPGRWTQDEPVSYAIRRIEHTWSGMLTQTIRFAR